MAYGRIRTIGRLGVKFIDISLTSYVIFHEVDGFYYMFSLLIKKFEQVFMHIGRSAGTSFVLAIEPIIERIGKISISLK